MNEHQQLLHDLMMCENRVLAAKKELEEAESQRTVIVKSINRYVKEGKIALE